MATTIRKMSLLQILCLFILFNPVVPTPTKIGKEIVLPTEGSDVMACSEHTGDPEKRLNAYMVMIGPFTPQRTYKKWLYAVIALSSALKKYDSKAEFVILCAQKDHNSVHALPEEEELMSRNGIHWRYVSAPYGNGGFHMGHFKLWAWQHTEYAQIQLLDADLLPLVNMDRFFELGQSLDSDFIGCPGKLSVLNAGWFLLKPSCHHFEAMTQIIKNDGHSSWSNEVGWGHPLPYWISSEEQKMKSGWSFFDGHGNQGHMYSYFLFDGKDLTLIYADRIMSYTNGSLDHGDNILDEISKYDKQKYQEIKTRVFEAYPCPFPLKIKTRAYYHFTGNVKPWTKYNPTHPQFKLWYEAVEASGDINVERDVFGGQLSS